MKKLISLAMVALLALGANVSAQEEQQAGERAGAAVSGSEGAAAAGSTIGGIATTNVIIGAVALGVATAIIANDGGEGIDPPVCDANEIIQNGQCICPSGFGIDGNGNCIPETFVCNDGGDLVDGNICLIPPGGLIPGTTTTTTVTITYPATIFP